jgi:hypothetical protein
LVCNALEIEKHRAWGMPETAITATLDKGKINDAGRSSHTTGVIRRPVADV